MFFLGAEFEGRAFETGEALVCSSHITSSSDSDKSGSCSISVVDDLEASGDRP